MPQGLTFEEVIATDHDKHCHHLLGILALRPVTDMLQLESACPKIALPEGHHIMKLPPNRDQWKE